MTLKALLFDFDGTLADSEEAHLRVWNHLLAPLGKSLSEEEYSRKYTGLPVVATVEDLIKRLELPFSVNELVEQKIQNTAKVFAEHPPALMPHVLKTLEWAKNIGLRMALVTGSGREEVMSVYHHYDFDQYFECVVTRSDVTHTKPDPESYLSALAQLGLGAAEGVALEDTAVGVASARNAQLDVIAIPHEHTRLQDFSKATYVASSMENAVEWIKQERLD